MLSCQNPHFPQCFCLSKGPVEILYAFHGNIIYRGLSGFHYWQCVKRLYSSQLRQAPFPFTLPEWYKISFSMSKNKSGEKLCI